MLVLVKYMYIDQETSIYTFPKEEYVLYSCNGKADQDINDRICSNKTGDLIIVSKEEYDEPKNKNEWVYFINMLVKLYDVKIAC